MREYVARLIKCGMPRDVALCICRSFARDYDYISLEHYIDSVEEEIKYKEADEF